MAPLVAALEAEGWSVWWDPEITPGEEFDSLISRELESARSVVVVWTAGSAESRWVRGEARDAADRGALVPVRFGNAKLPIDFRAVHTTDLDNWGGDRNGAAFRGLFKALEAKLGTPKRPASAATAADRKAEVSICVLPFANMSGDPEQEYFSDGITEDIITDLGKVSALSVVSRNMAFSFKGAKGGVGDIGRQTSVSYVLVGSVRKAGERVRITAQLVDAANEAQVWGERYDRDLSDIFALQDEISKAIVSALKLTLLPEEKRALEQRATTNVKAYKFYLMARQFSVMGNDRHQEIIVRLCRRAVELDPSYAAPWATMAIAQWDMHRRSACAEDGQEAAKRAIALDANLAESHAALGAAYLGQGEFEAGLQACKAALALDPNSYDGNRIAGMCSTVLRLFDDAIRYFEKALGRRRYGVHCSQLRTSVLRGKRRSGGHAPCSASSPRSHRKGDSRGARPRACARLRREPSGKSRRGGKGEGVDRARHAARSEQYAAAVQSRLYTRAAARGRAGA